jgi:Right handed beta helix region
MKDIVGLIIGAALALAPFAAAAQSHGAVIHVDSQIGENTCTTYAPSSRQCGRGSETAVRTIAAAASAAGPGTTVIIREGVYREPLVPRSSGTSDQPITFQAAGGEPVIISGVADAPALQIIGRNYIVVEGLTVEDVVGWGRLQDATGNIVRQMTFRRATAGGTTGGLKLVRASGNRIVGNTFEDGNDNVLLQDNSNGNVVADNLFSRARHSLMSIRCSGTNVIRGNTFDNPDQKAMEIYDCEGVSDAPVRLNSTLRNLIEKNTFLRTRPTGRNYAYNAIQHGGQLTNVRRNLFKGSAGGGVNFQYYERESLFVYGNRLTHNTFYGNHCFAVVGVSGAPREYVENRVINNLLYKNRDCEGAGDQVSIRDPQAVILIGNAVESEAPGFVNEEAGDLRLAENSRLIDAAGPLTRTTAEGSGTVLPVTDPVPFFDGFGIPGEVGDEIQLLGSGERARILKIDLAPRLLILDRPLTWQNNQGVALAFTGARPDPGAFEFEPPPVVEPPVVQAPIDEPQATSPELRPNSTRPMPAVRKPAEK